jgi:hypothetical protein
MWTFREYSCWINSPFDKNLISVTDSNITTIPYSEITNHTAETSLTEPILTGASSRFKKIPISRKDEYLWYRCLILKIRKYIVIPLTSYSNHTYPVLH